LEPQLQLKRIAAAITLAVAASTTVYAQESGKIAGKIVDIETLQPISGVSVSLVGTNKGTSTNDKGEFILDVSTRGTIKIVSSYVGYNRDTTSVILNSDISNVSIALVSENSALDEVVITRRRSQVSELAILDERKKSNLMIEKIGAQELSRKGVSDAEGALTKMSGVTKSASGSNVFVRGLGDRYNSTTLNGLALPSEDPITKNISLDFFNTSVIQSIGVNKTFNPLINADVAGANIDILSKNLTEDSFLEIGASSGINTQAINAKDFQRIDGTSWFGNLNERKIPITDLTKFDFHNKLNTSTVKNPINSSYSIAGGKRFQIGEGNLNVFLTGNMNSEYKYSKGVLRQTTTTGTIFRDQESVKSDYNVSKTGMANLRYTFGKNYIAFNSLFINDQTQNYTRNYGLDASVDPNDKRLFRRQQVIDNKIFVNQLLSNIELTEIWKVDLGVGYNVVKGLEPDRRTVVLREPDGGGTYQLLAEENSNQRQYSDIDEKGWSTKALATYKILNEEGFDRKIEFGYNGEFVDRKFNATIFNQAPIGDRTINSDYVNDLDQIFNSTNLASKLFEIRTGRGQSLDPYWYTASKKVHSGVAMATYQFDEKLTAVLGLRFDNVFQDVIYNTNIGNTDLDGYNPFKKNYILPSLNLKYALTDNSNLRASGSMSYTLPQFAELAYFNNAGANGSTQGNKNLVPVENTNIDLKWELFPNQGELISVGVFYKNLKNPIAQTERGSNVITFYNVGGKATVTGAEIEIKKNLLKTVTDKGSNILSAGANVSYLYSSQRLENIETLFTKTGGTSKLQGASPLLLNADVSYLLNGKDWNLTSTAVLNYFSDRIYAIGAQGFNDIVEKGVPTLDFVSSANIHKKWGVSLKARNLLNPNVRLERKADNMGNIVLESYKRGVDLSLGVSYKF